MPSFKFIKLANASPVCLQISEQSGKLYCSTKEGLLLIFDVNKADPVMIHAVRLVMVPVKKDAINYAK
jgi:hypothetical protein